MKSDDITMQAKGLKMFEVMLDQNDDEIRCEIGQIAEIWPLFQQVLQQPENLEDKREFLLKLKVMDVCWKLCIGNATNKQHCFVVLTPALQVLRQCLVKQDGNGTFLVCAFLWSAVYGVDANKTLVYEEGRQLLVETGIKWRKTRVMYTLSGVVWHLTSLSQECADYFAVEMLHLIVEFLASEIAKNEARESFVPCLCVAMCSIYTSRYVSDPR